MFSIDISFSKNRDILPLARTPGTGSKNRNCPGKIGTLGRPEYYVFVKYGPRGKKVVGNQI